MDDSAIGASSCVMNDDAVGGASSGNAKTTSLGYATISLSCSSIGTSSTLGVRARSPTLGALASSCTLGCGSFCYTLGAGGGL